MRARLPRLLVVEDERAHQLIIEKSLKGFYEFEIASSLKEAREMISSQAYDLFLLDIVLPDGTGFEVLSELRKSKPHQMTPVIFLTVREDLKSKLIGFSLGADDYMTKPPEPLELRARIDTRLRVVGDIQVLTNKTVMRVGDMKLDTERLAVIIEEGGQEVPLDLTPLEFRLLLFFVRNPDEPLSRQKILQGVWGDHTHVLDRSVDSYVATLRRKLGPRSNVIKSVHKVGYRLNPGFVKKAA